MSEINTADLGVGQGADATKAATEPVRRPDSLPEDEQVSKEAQFQQDVLNIANRVNELYLDSEMVNGYVARKLRQLDTDLRAAVRRVRGVKP